MLVKLLTVFTSFNNLTQLQNCAFFRPRFFYEPFFYLLLRIYIEYEKTIFPNVFCELAMEKNQRIFKIIFLRQTHL